MASAAPVGGSTGSAASVGGGAGGPTAAAAAPGSAASGGGAGGALSAASTLPALDPANKEEILRIFQSMTQQRDALTDKLSELLYSHSEYKCVPHLPPLAL